MIKKEKYHFEPNQVKLDILDFILKNNEPVREPEIREYLKKKYGGINQSNVNRPLHWLYEKNCIELEKSRSNIWSVKTPKNLENIVKEFPDFIEILQNNGIAQKIVLDTIEDELVSSTNLKKTKEYKEKYDVIKEHLLKIRKDLTEKFKISSSFFKLCIQDEFSLGRNLNDLFDISDDPTATPYIGDGFILFIKSPACIDLLFKSCIAIEIMERKVNDKKNMKNEIEYIKRVNNSVKEDQLKILREYYENLIKERNTINNLGNTDPSKQQEYLKANYEKFLEAPGFIKDTKFVRVRNSELYKIENEFENKDGKWNFPEHEYSYF